MTDTPHNFSVVKQGVVDACSSAKRPAGAARLLAVSKRFPVEAIEKVIAAGHDLFGESRIQEAEEKIPQLPDHLEWHFIGHIQKNKVRKILQLFGTLHSVDSLKLAKRIDLIAAELQLRPKIFLQVNIASEESKHGFTPTELKEQFPEISKLQNLEILGLMAIPPAVDDPEDSRPQFRAVRELQEELARGNDYKLQELSIGMSGDYRVAIEEGSTIVRVGSLIFGQRET